MTRHPLTLTRTPEVPGDFVGVYIGDLPVGTVVCLDQQRGIYVARCSHHLRQCHGIPEALAFIEGVILKDNGFLAARLEPTHTPKEPNE